MPITLQDVFEDPELFLYEFDAQSAHFLAMRREDFRRSIFLDGRIKHAGKRPIRVPLDQLQAAHANMQRKPRSIGWIFHVAQCGSTLIARALDLPGRSLVLREPAALRRIGIVAGAAGGKAELLPMTRDLLAKRFDEKAPVIVKANVPVNFIADDIMREDPDAPALLLYFPLQSYVAAILRTPGHVEWTQRVSEELGLAKAVSATGNPAETPAQLAGALWYEQVRRYAQLLGDYPKVRSLHAAEIFDNAAETIAAAANLFDVALEDGEAERIANSELYHSYSKNPALDYDPEVRLAREAEAMQRLKPEIEEARAWVDRAMRADPLPDALDRPLVGEAPNLLG